MAFNLSKSLKSNLTTAVNTIRTTVDTVSNDVGSAANKFTADLSSATGLSSKKINASLLGAAAGGLLNGNKGAALGALAGGLLGGGGADNLLGQVRNKLSGLIDSAEELQGLISEPLKLVEKGAADLSGLTGEYGLTLEQFRELSQRTQYTDFVDSGFAPSFKGDDSSASKLPNPLRNHNGSNYVITLGILGKKEYNNPEIYRKSGGFKNYVIKSSGGDLSRRTQVYDETVGNTYSDFGDAITSHAEYYIDDIEIDAVLSPNPSTRVTMGTALSFTVTEPYSMGNFIQAIITAAQTAGYGSYNEAPFCLKIDFVGWNLGGDTPANFITEPMFIPIKFINMDFNVSGTGSTYAVKAVPMSETGLRDNVNKANVPVKATGTFCHEVLETNDKSVTRAINQQIESLEEVGALAPYDRYIICFPKTRQELKNALQTGTITESAFTTSPKEQEEQRSGAIGGNPQLRAAYSAQTLTIEPPNDTYAILKSFAENTNLMNEIGLSPLNVDSNAAGNAGAAEANQVVNPETNLVDTASSAAQTPDKAREFQFEQGQQITTIIEKIVMQTEYCAENSTKDAPNGLKKWFKIDTQVYLGDSPITEQQMGRTPKIFVYSVIPHEIDEAVTMAGNKKPKNTKGLRASAVKEYNYIYTGRNEDVLSFDINFNNAFLMTANADLGMSNANLRTADQNKVNSSGNGTDGGASAPAETDAKTNDEPGGETGYTDRVAISSGTSSNDVRRQVAEMFHDRITNMTIDMVSAEMEIMGDPFYIPQQTGNYVAETGDKPGITKDGTMNYLDTSVFCIVNFRTPFDYQVKGSTMEFPQIVPGFSGLFQVRAVTNKFSRGKFTQTLKLIRRKGQDDKETTGPSGFIQVNNKVALNKDAASSDGTVGQSGQTSTDCFPAPANDDIRKINPAIGADVAAKLSQENASLEKVINIPNIPDLIEGVDFGVAKVPDLTKIISSVSSSVGFDAGQAASQLNAAASQAQDAVNKATADISAVTNAAKSRVKNLLGGF
jgi:hypothetical protein